MKNCYGIKLIDDRIQVFDFATAEYLKNNGEKVWLFNEPDFWPWLERKIGYQGELLSFLVITERDTFDIPESFHLETNNGITEEAYNEFTPDDQLITILSYPAIGFTKKVLPKKNTVLNEVADILCEDNKNQLVEHYKNKTKEYDRC